ncbi:MAG: zinc ribbon domain-containing protein [Gemmatimonadota bacterium]
MTLYLGVALVTAAVVLFLIHPVIQGIHASLDREDDELTETEARKRVALLALRDVEYDFLAGKLDEDDYRTMKAKLTAEALAALAADEEAKETGAMGSAELEAEIAAIRRGLQGAVRCAACDFSNPAGSKFCSACGQPLLETVVS